MEQDQLAVCRKADVGLEPVGAGGDGSGESGRRGVGAVGTPQPMCVEGRNLRAPRRRVTRSRTSRDRYVNYLA
jgi:hypothetical protein